MGHAFGDIAFTPTVKALQETSGSRANYARMAAQTDPAEVRLTDSEAAFIGARDSFYMATVGETGWPYPIFSVFSATYRNDYGKTLIYSRPSLESAM